MRKSKFSEVQIAAILKEAEAGVAVAEVARKHAISAATFYQWRSQVRRHGSVGHAVAAGAGTGECEAQAVVRGSEPGSLDPQGDADKKVLTPKQRRAAVDWAVEEKQVSQRRACRIAQQSRASQRRELRGRTVNDEGVERRLQSLAEAHPAWGCPQLHRQLRQEGHAINHKRAWRLYVALGLTLRRRRRRRPIERDPQPLLQPLRPNEC